VLPQVVFGEFSVEDAAGAHPTEKTLQAHALGRLAGASAAAVGFHLSACAKCRIRAAEISSSPFLNELRRAYGQHESRPPAGVSFPAMSATEARTASMRPAPAGSLPSGLAGLPDYEILGELGRGGMGVVYLAHNKLMGRKEVLKVVSRELINRRGVLDRFLREIRNAAQLHHPNIVTAYAAMRAGESIVFAMEYVEGYDLSQLVKGRGPLPVAHACNFVFQAAQGLQYAHQKGMVHRDIKPSNMILAREGNKPVLKVLDFGLAKATSERSLDGGLTAEGQMLGTPDYIAPEQSLDAQKADIRADIYSLGCTLYHLLSGNPPFRASSLYEILQAHHSIEAKPLNLVRSDVPWELAAVVAKMMAKPPNRRYQTPGEVAAALKPFFKGIEADIPAQKLESSRSGLPETVVRTPDPKFAHEPLGAKSFPARPSSLSHDVAAEAKSVGMNVLVHPEGATASDVLCVSSSQIRPPPARWLWPTVVGGFLLMALLIVLATGDFDAKPSDGLIVLENAPELATVEIDGEQVAVVRVEGARGRVRFKARPGRHGVVVKRGERVVLAKSVDIAAGKEITVTASAENLRDVGDAPAIENKNSRALGDTAAMVEKAAARESAALHREMPEPTPAPPADRVNPQLSTKVPDSLVPRQASLLANEPPFPSAAHDPSKLPRKQGRPMLVAPYCATSPIADGVVTAEEYGNAPFVDFTFTPNNRFTAFFTPPNPTGGKQPDDLSVRLRAAYSDQSLFLAFQVRDQFVDDQESDRDRPQFNDGIEIFLDGDRVSNDFLFVYGQPVKGSSEGFQLIANAAGHQATVSRDFTNRDWKAAGKKNGAGYVTEVEIPLSLIDVKDGPRRIAAGPGSVFNFAFAVNDNDTAAHNQSSYAFVRAHPSIGSPILAPENSWSFGIELAAKSTVANPIPERETAWQPLFNGRDLSGWKPHPRQPGNWHVKDGILIGSGPAASYLYTNRDDYRNVHLRAQARINTGGNSGVYARASFGPTVPTKKPVRPAGYQGRINTTHNHPDRIGGLFVTGVGDTEHTFQSFVKPGEWFRMEIIVEGYRIIFKVNDTITADYTDPKRRFASGHIALQQNDPRTVVEFRKIEIRELR
jgi:serine/threonine protein kinase